MVAVIGYGWVCWEGLTIFSINLRCFVASSSKEMGCLNYLFRDMSKTVLYSKGVLILTKMGLCKIWHRSGYRSQLLLVFWVTFQQSVEIIKKIGPWDIFKLWKPEMSWLTRTKSLMQMYNYQSIDTLLTSYSRIQLRHDGKYSKRSAHLLTNCVE